MGAPPRSSPCCARHCARAQQVQVPHVNPRGRTVAMIETQNTCKKGRFSCLLALPASPAGMQVHAVCLRHAVTAAADSLADRPAGPCVSGTVVLTLTACTVTCKGSFPRSTHVVVAGFALHSHAHMPTKNVVVWAREWWPRESSDRVRVQNSMSLRVSRTGAGRRGCGRLVRGRLPGQQHGKSGSAGARQHSAADGN